MAEVITVTALNRYVKALLDGSDLLYDLALGGEVANFVRNAKSGHCYFTLRDSQCSVKAVMFRSDAQRLAFRPEEGMRVVVRCRVTLYEPSGAYQVYVNAMFPDGIGEAQLALEQLKARLQAEGLFAPERKKPLPAYPQKIGLVTSRTGAALQDIKNVIGRRWPAVKLILCPVSVQGFEAAQEVAGAIGVLDRYGVDEIIVARGGGSREDLWVFNAECIARAAYRCKTPLISAIGHEIDYTILDFVADCRAPTPSAAAELAVPDREELRRQLWELKENIQGNMQKRREICYNDCKACEAALAGGLPRRKAEAGETRLAALSEALRAASRARWKDKNRQFAHAAALTASLNPYQVLARGYAMVAGPDGKVRQAGQLEAGQTIRLIAAHRRAECLVTAVEETDESTQNI